MLERERRARKEAERIMEDKSHELYKTNVSLQELNASLEAQIRARTADITSANKRLQLLFDRHPLPLLVFGIDRLDILDVNQTAIEKYGYSKERFLSMRIVDLHVKEEIPQLNEHLRQLEQKSTQETVWKHVLQTGKVIDVEVSATSLQYEGVAARMVLMQDVTERKSIREALERSEKKYLSLIHI